MSEPVGLNEFLNAPAPTAQAQAPQGNEPAGLSDFIAPELNQEKHGGVLENLKAAGEGVERGLTFGASDLIHTAEGENPEDIKGRIEANPIASTVGNIAGGAAPLIMTGGLSAPAEAITGGAGLAASSLAGLGEGALFGAGSAVSDYALGDPDLNAQKVLADVGIGGVLGMGLGALTHGASSLFGKFGNPKGSIAESLAGEADSANRASVTSDAIANEAGLKANAPDVMDAADRLNLPVMQGQVSSDPWIQKAEDALINGSPTYSGIRRAKLYEQGYNGAVDALDDILPDSQISKNQLGDAIQGSLSNKIDAEAQPFNDLYSAIKEDTENIPLKDGSAPAISRNILDIPEIKRSFNSPAAKLAKDVAEEIPNLSSVDDLRAYQTELNGRLSPTAPPAEKRILALVSDKLDAWEQRAIKGHAEDFISNIENRTDMTPEEKQSIWGDKIDRMKTLMSRIDDTDKEYSAFRSKINDLSGWLGKGKVYGAKDAMDFIQNRLEPEDLINKLTSKKYAGLYDFMEKNFPQEAAVLREYQKSALRDSASPNGVFNPKSFLKKVNDLEPEIQSAIFHPDELQKLNDVRTYLNSLPRNFNPSGTSSMSAFRQFFDGPVNAATSNLRDFGIESYIKTMGALPEGMRANPYKVGSELSERLNKYQAIRAVTDRVTKQIAENASSIIYGTGVSATGNSNRLLSQSYDQKVKRIQELAQNPDALSSQVSMHINGLTNALPTVSGSLAKSMATSVSYLNSKVPRPQSQLPLSTTWKPSDPQKQTFDRYYNAVNDPMSVMKQVKTGSLTSEAMEALQVTHPDLLKEMRQQLTAIGSPDKAKELPYKTIQSLSMFMGQPLDESLLPTVRMANQATFAMPNPQSQNQMSGKPTKGGMQKLNIAGRAKTGTYRDQAADE